MSSQKRPRETSEAEMHSLEGPCYRFGAFSNPNNESNKHFDIEDSINEAAYEIDWSELFNSASAIPQERYQLLSEGKVEVPRLESYLANKLVQQLLEDYKNAYVRGKQLEKDMAMMKERMEELEEISTECNNLKQIVQDHVEASIAGLTEFSTFSSIVQTLVSTQSDRLETLSRMSGCWSGNCNSMEQSRVMPSSTLLRDCNTGYPDVPSEDAMWDHARMPNNDVGIIMRFNVDKMEYSVGREPVHAIHVECIGDSKVQDSKGNLVEMRETYFLKKDLLRAINKCLPEFLSKKDLTGLVKSKPRAFNIDRATLARVEWTSSDSLSDLWLPKLKAFAASNPSRGLAFIHKCHIAEILQSALNQLNSRKVKDADVWLKALKALQDTLNR